MDRGLSEGPGGWEGGDWFAGGGEPQVEGVMRRACTPDSLSTALTQLTLTAPL